MTTLEKKLLTARLESLYNKVEEMAKAVGKEEITKIIGERAMRDSINATFFELILLKTKHGDPVLKEDLTLTLLVAATMLKQ